MAPQPQTFSGCSETKGKRRGHEVGRGMGWELKGIGGGNAE